MINDEDEFRTLERTNAKGALAAARLHANDIAAGLARMRQRIVAYERRDALVELRSQAPSGSELEQRVALAEHRALELGTA